MPLKTLLESVRTDDGPHGVEIPCVTHGAYLWFSDSPGEVEQAKRLCHDCPVRASCLDDAVERKEPAGVWGGELFVAGVIVPFRRPRGRPRSSARSAWAAASRAGGRPARGPSPVPCTP